MYNCSKIYKLKMEIEQNTKELAPNEQLDLIQQCLDSAKEFGLEAEVFLYSMMELKKDPSLTIEEAVVYGLKEWVK